MSGTSTSSASLTTMGLYRTQTSESYSTLVAQPLVPKSKTSTPRNYEAAFGNLSSTYGWGAPVPSPSFSLAASSQKAKRASKAAPAPQPSPESSSLHDSAQSAAPLRTLQG